MKAAIRAHIMRAGARTAPSHSEFTRTVIKILLATSLSFFVLIALPVALSAARYWQTANSEWWAADRSSAGLLPPARARSDSMVRVYAARTVRWKGIFAVHTWIVLKQGAGP
ncbi:MAG: hypothetical protein QOJ52_4055, partial [Acidimicrobiaceae bacterium]|nr:hypothetical protein [Acidimicrobiaceae bacterium]